MTALEARGLSCSYGKHPVLRDLNIDVQQGQILALMGPNGSGKTTALRALARQLKPRGGKVLLQEADIWKQTGRNVARQLAMSPQVEHRDWPITVEHAVSLGRTPHRGWLLPFTAGDRDSVTLALQKCGLEDFRQRPVTELSGGEWRRVVLARTLAQEPTILLLDEPLADLDLRYQHELLKSLRRLAEGQQLAVVITLHDLNVAAMVAHRIGLLADGRLLSLGSPAEVCTAENIQKAFQVEVLVTPHPVYGTPMVSPLAEVVSPADSSSTE